MLTKLTIIIAINHFIIIVNLRNCFGKALVEIFQFHRALTLDIQWKLFNVIETNIIPLWTEQVSKAKFA